MDKGRTVWEVCSVKNVSHRIIRFFQDHPQVVKRVGQLLMKVHLIFLDYPVPDPTPRYGYGKPPHSGLYEIIDSNRSVYEQYLSIFIGYEEDFTRIPAGSPHDAGEEPCWINGYLPGLDGVAIYSLLARTNPGRYFEIGSGSSTKFARRAIIDHDLRTKIVSWDPRPRSEIDAICDEIHRVALEKADLSQFEDLDAGDIIFVDDGHRVFTNYGPTVFFLDIMPRLKSGVIVGIHDIYLPMTIHLSGRGCTTPSSTCWRPTSWRVENVSISSSPAYSSAGTPT